MEGAMTVDCFMGLLVSCSGMQQDADVGAEYQCALEKILLLATVDTKVYLRHGVALRQDV